MVRQTSTLLPRLSRYWIMAGLCASACAVVILLFIHPSRPLRMRHEAVSITVAADGVRLAGTLSLPRWRSGPHPAVIFVHGSGRSVRSDMITDVRRFVDRGMAVYTYDKRGVGESSGTFAEPSSRHSGVLQELALHARAAYEEVCRRPEIDATRVGFFGVSQAGWIIPLAATMTSSSPAPRFAILLSGPAVSTGVEEFYSELTADGRNPQALADMTRIRAAVDDYRGPAGYDPKAVLSRFHTPSLWILGELDLSVPTWASVRALAALKQQYQLPLDWIIYPDAGHDLRPDSGEPNPRIWLDIERFLSAHQLLP